MTDDALRTELEALEDRVQRLEADSDRLKGLPDAVARIEGVVQTLTNIVTGRGVASPSSPSESQVGKASSWDTALKFATTVLVPIILALIGGYFALKAGVSSK